MANSAEAMDQRVTTTNQPQTFELNGIEINANALPDPFDALDFVDRQIEAAVQAAPA